MSNDKYTEAFCRAKLERQGLRFTDSRTFTIPTGRLGIKALGMVDYLVNYCGMRVAKQS